MSRERMLKAGICLSAWLLAAPVSADQLIAIRHGAMVLPFFQNGSVELSGTRGFKFQGAVIDWGFTAMTICSDEGVCPPGAVVSLGAGAAGSGVNGTARLRGTTFIDVGSLSSTENLVLMFSGQATMPAMSDGPTTMTAPFDFAGSFSYQQDGEQHTDLLTGGGLVTMFIEPHPDGASWLITGAEFTLRPRIPVSQ